MAEPQPQTQFPIRFTDVVFIHPRDTLFFSFDPSGPSIKVEVWRPLGLLTPNAKPYLKNSRVPQGSFTFSGPRCQAFVESILAWTQQQQKGAAQHANTQHSDQSAD